jgi:hypothetical protein
VRRLRRLTEAECYARLYGAGDRVRLVIVPRRRLRSSISNVSGEELRRDFEARLDARDPESEPEAA